MHNPIDNPEDPRLLKIHTDRLIKRDIDQLLGICEFALQDGHIDQDEAKSILSWLHDHSLCLDTWPANVLFDRLRTMLADNKLDAEEQHDLLSLIMAIVKPRSNHDERLPATLPVNLPEPSIVFPDRSFCFTGIFDFGSRADCQEAVAKLGGIPAKGITKKLHYLVIGSVASEVWSHTSFGNKIAKAIEYRNTGVSLAIVTEQHWVKHLA